LHGRLAQLLIGSLQPSRVLLREREEQSVVNGQCFHNEYLVGVIKAQSIQ